MASRSKYNAMKTVVDGIKFDSKKEAAYYEYLKLRQRAGTIKYFLRQVPFDLPGNIRYRVDFMAVQDDDTIQYFDVKGFKTAMYKLKKKQVEALYPGVVIEEV